MWVELEIDKYLHTGMNTTTILRKIRRKVLFWLIERRYESSYEGQKYLYIPNKNSKDLVVVFSGFTGEKPKYNYVMTLNKIPINKLFILDNYGYKGCYYLMSEGSRHTEHCTSHIIEMIRNSNSIKKVITAGSSKGGSAALYFGLKHNADIIISAACQYYIGTYLVREKHRKILDAMLCAPNSPNYNLEASVKELDETIYHALDNYNNNIINLFYSDVELTYERQIKPLVEELRRRKIPFEETIEHFQKHEDVGIYFAEYLKRKILEII